jgi:NADPH-dependent ferric siderophore reductase
MLPEPRTWHLDVAAVQEITPRMRRVRLTSPALEAFEYLPGQDMALVFRRDDDPTVRRRYTIRGFDRGRRLLELEFVMHGDGPGMRWAQAAQPGTAIETVGPRGKITLASGADLHLFAGDATAVPGAFAMMEALPAHIPVLAFFQVDGPQERQPIPNDRRHHAVTWRYELPQPGEGGDLVAAVAAAELPGGRGHAYLAGEVALVTALKATLQSRGWTADQISAKAYWNRGRANAGHGEPELKAS